LPVRNPGDTFWKEISEVLKKNKKIEEMKAE
jgi:hypothetical protein